MRLSTLETVQVPRAVKTLHFVRAPCTRSTTFSTTLYNATSVSSTQVSTTTVRLEKAASLYNRVPETKKNYDFQRQQRMEFKGQTIRIYRAGRKEGNITIKDEIRRFIKI